MHLVLVFLGLIAFLGGMAAGGMIEAGQLTAALIPSAAGLACVVTLLAIGATLEEEGY